MAIIYVTNKEYRADLKVYEENMNIVLTCPCI